MAVFRVCSPKLIARLGNVGASDVLRIRVAGQIDLAGLQRIRAAVSHAEAKVRSVQADLTALRLLPTAADISA